MADLLFVGQFIASKAGKTGLTVTVDVDRYALADGSRTALVTAGSATEGRRGLYSYRLASADLATYQYVATFITADATVDQQEIATLGIVVPDALVGSRLAPAVAGRTLDVDASGNAAANVTHHAGVAVAAADANGNVPVDVKLWKGSAPSDLVSGEVPAKMSSSSGQIIADATKLAPDAGMPAIGSVASILPKLPTAEDVQIAAEAALAAYDPATKTQLDAAVAPLALEATAQAVLEDTGTTLPTAIAVVDANVDLLLAMDTSTTDATTAGAISRRRGNSWSIPLTIGAITGYTSLWFTIKSSHDDADTAAIVQIKKNASASLDGLLYVNGTTASSDALGSITVNNATTGAIVIAVDETITDDLAPGEYCYDVQTLIAGDVATPDSGTFTVTADVTRSVV